MNAIISGRSDQALIIQGDSLWTFSSESGTSKLARKPGEIPLLFQGDTSLRFLENVEITEIATELHHAVLCDEALHLILIVFDPDLSEEIRLEACEVLESMSWEEEIYPYIFDILYAHPLPERSDIHTAISLCERTEARVLGGWLRRLLKHQSIITAVRIAWEAVPDSLFESSSARIQFQYIAVSEGLFWDLVTDLDTVKSVQSFINGISSIASVSTYPHYREIIEQWTENLNLTGVFHHTEPAEPNSSQPNLTDRDKGYIKAGRDIVSASSIGLPLQSSENENPVAQIWQQFREHGDEKARDQLIQRYAHLVSIMAGRLIGPMPSDVERDDLIGEGMVVLVNAVDQFDPTHGIKFETYAIVHIRSAILEMLRGNNTAPHLVRDPLSEETDLEDATTIQERQRALAVAIDRLPERERVILALYYHEGLTFKEIGKILSISEARVYQIHSQAIMRLRSYLGNDTGFFDYHRVS